MDFQIKKIIQNLYNVNYNNVNLTDGEELITEDGVSDFVQLYKKYDIDKGIIVSPSGYEKGLCFKKIGEVYNPASWLPELVKFNLNFFGLKRNSIYKLTIIARNTGDNTIVTQDRSLLVTNSSNECLIKEDLSNTVVNKEFHAIFRASGNEITLFFTLGKIFLRDIILDEVEIVNNDEVAIEENVNEEPGVTFTRGKLDLAAYGIFTLIPVEDNNEKRYCELSRYSGKGINLYLDKKTNSFLLERDNKEEVLTNSFINANYIVNINTDKLINPHKFVSCITTEMENDVSPNTLKQGYLRFEFIGPDGKALPFQALSGRVYILVQQLF